MKTLLSSILVLFCLSSYAQKENKVIDSSRLYKYYGICDTVVARKRFGHKFEPLPNGTQIGSDKYTRTCIGDSAWQYKEAGRSFQWYILKSTEKYPFGIWLPSGKIIGILKNSQMNKLFFTLIIGVAFCPSYGQKENKMLDSVRFSHHTLVGETIVTRKRVKHKKKILDLYGPDSASPHLFKYVLTDSPNLFEIDTLPNKDSLPLEDVFKVDTLPQQVITSGISSGMPTGRVIFDPTSITNTYTLTMPAYPYNDCMTKCTDTLYNIDHVILYTMLGTKKDYTIRKLVRRIDAKYVRYYYLNGVTRCPVKNIYYKQ